MNTRVLTLNSRNKPSDGHLEAPEQMRLIWEDPGGAAVGLEDCQRDYPYRSSFRPPECMS